MIVSVPHTGTRSLKEVLGEPNHWHFCQNEKDFEQLEEVIHFPVRDPLDTTVSWRSWQSDRTDMDEFRRWEAAIDYLETYKPGVIYHVMERYKVMEGIGPGHWAKDRLAEKDLERLKTLPEVVFLLEWIQRKKIRDFFHKFYGEFWWLEDWAA